VSSLDPEIEELLVRLFEASQAVPRPKRRFFAVEVDGVTGTLITGPGFDMEEVARQDLVELDAGGLIAIENINISGSFEFYVTQQGNADALEIKSRGEPLERPEEEVRQFLEAETFRKGYPNAYAKWRQAADYVALDPVEHATRIGHDCREAMAEFASALLQRHGMENRGGGTVDAIRAVLHSQEGRTGQRVRAFHDALLAYWGTVSDLAQRQEHGARKEGEGLGPADGRRCVWYTGLVMYELATSLETQADGA
jgi:hypothetical protein